MSLQEAADNAAGKPKSSGLLPPVKGAMDSEEPAPKRVIRSSGSASAALPTVATRGGQSERAHVEVGVRKQAPRRK